MKKAAKKILAFAIAAMMILPVIPAMTVSAAPFYRGITMNTAAVSDAGDGQSGNNKPTGDQRVTAAYTAGNRDFSNCAGMYFVFDVYVGAGAVPDPGMFVILPQGGSGGWWGAGARFCYVSKELSPAGSNWVTFYSEMTGSNMLTDWGVFSADAGVLSNVTQFGFSGGSRNITIKNPRFQDTPYSTPAAELAGRTQTSLSVQADANTSQTVEFAVSAAAAVPSSGWVDGTLTGGKYTAEFDGLNEGAQYYVFTRTKADPTYNFTGTAFMMSFETAASDVTAVSFAAAAVTWDLIKNANTDPNQVTNNLNLPTAGLLETSVSWAWVSSNGYDYAVDPFTGAVTRPQNGLSGESALGTLTATVSRGDESLPVYFDLTVLSDRSDMDAIDDTLAAITWNAIRSVNTSEASVTSGLTLSAAATNGTVIVWSSSDDDVINTIPNRNTDYKEGIPMGMVFRQSAAATVTLTATVTRNASSKSTDFILTVPAADPSACEVTFNGPNIGNQTANGASICALGDGTPPSINNYASGTGAPGWTLRPADYLYVWIDNPLVRQAAKVIVAVELWRPSSPGNFQIQYNSTYPGSDEGTSYAMYYGMNSTGTGGAANSAVSGNYYRYTFTLENCNFNLKNAQGYPIGQNKRAQFRVTNGGGSNVNIKKITVTAVPLTNAEAVAVTKTALTWDVIKNANTLQNAVTTDLRLVTDGNETTETLVNTNISWVSSRPDVVAPDGAVTRRETDVNVTLTAAISRDMNDYHTADTLKTDSVTFTIVVRGDGSGMSDADAIAAMKSELTWDVIKKGNFEQSKVTTDLNLLTLGKYSTDISWTSTVPAAVSAGGAVTRNAVSAIPVTVTATISRGGESDTAVFELNVIALNDYANSVRPTIKTLYPTKDWVVSDFNALDFGAKTMAEDPGFDNRLAFQAAIDAAYNAGGGVVWIPAGTYAFYSENSSGVTLDLKQSVTLRGDWINPEDNGGAAEGTILAVYSGKGRGLDRTNEPGTLGCFIAMVQGSGVTNLSIWYPEQSITGTAVLYPWTLKQTGGDSATVENVTLVNSYGGFRANPAELHYLLNVYMTALKVGVEIHTCTDIGRIENVNINPKYWANSGLPGAPALSEAAAYTKNAANQARGFSMHRSDWEYIAYLNISGYYEGLWVGRESGNSSDSPNAQLFGLNIEDCVTGFYVDRVNGYGLLISDSKFGGTNYSVQFSDSFNTSVQFNGVDFNGPITSASAARGVVSYESCTFTRGGTMNNTNGGSCININGGTALIGNSTFLTPNYHIYITSTNSNAKLVNSGPLSGSLVISGTASRVLSNISGAAYDIEPIPRGVATDIGVHPRAAAADPDLSAANQTLMIRLDLPAARGFNNNVPTTDVAAELQAALDAMAAAGGGIVYLPGGRYLVESPIAVPPGVELRGTRDVQSHIQGGGSAIFTSYGAGEPGLPPLIQLKADSGIRGLHIAQLNQNTGEIGTGASSYKECPFLIQGQGADVYIINITMPNADKGVDLATYKTDRHYVDYAAGSGARAIIWVGGGADGGFIRNCQFNPHYALRFPNGMQGYPSVNLDVFQKANFSPLKFGDVTNQTIFNNFVYSAKYGMHFIKDEATGKYPGEMTVIGHGADGSTYCVFVEEADADTKIVMINTELVTLPPQGITTERSYVLMGSGTGTEYTKVDPNARLILYNSSGWGSTNTQGISVNSGILRLQQFNFQASVTPNIRVRNNARVHVCNTYFQSSGTPKLNIAGANATGELTNNWYNTTGTPASGTHYTATAPGNAAGVYGSDVTANTTGRLYSLTLGEGAFAQAFNSGTTGTSASPAYTASVPYGAAEITVTALPVELQGTRITLALNGAAAAEIKGTAQASAGVGTFALNVGANNMAIAVTPKSGGTAVTYYIRVTRAPNTDASLSGLTVSESALSPAFAPGIYAYSVNAAAGVSSIIVEAAANDANASVGGAGEYALDEAQTEIVVTVTAEDGVTTMDYTITVNRASSFTCAVKTLTAGVGVKQQIAYTYSGPDSNKPAFTSSNSGICAVDNEGMLTPIKAGMAIITVKCGAVTMTIVVTVK